MNEPEHLDLDAIRGRVAVRADGPDLYEWGEGRPWALDELIDALIACKGEHGVPPTANVYAVNEGDGDVSLRFEWTRSENDHEVHHRWWMEQQGRERKEDAERAELARLKSKYEEGT